MVTGVKRTKAASRDAQAWRPTEATRSVEWLPWFYSVTKSCATSGGFWWAMWGNRILQIKWMNLCLFSAGPWTVKCRSRAAFKVERTSWWTAATLFGRVASFPSSTWSCWKKVSETLISIIIILNVMRSTWSCCLAGESCVRGDSWLFHQQALQEYILVCCQLPQGGLIDKPGKYDRTASESKFTMPKIYLCAFRHRDYYHTCYCLSGLSVAQHVHEGNISKKNVIGVAENELVRSTLRVVVWHHFSVSFVSSVYRKRLIQYSTSG